MIYIILLIGTVYYMLLDELMMANAQSSKGPYNLGVYGMLSSMVNGFNLTISQFLMPKLYMIYWFQAFPIAFLLFSLAIYNVIFPFLFVDLYLSFIILLLLSGLSIMLLVLLSFSGLSKYSILGCMSLMAQFVAYELVLTTLLLLVIYTYNCLNVTNYYLYLYMFNALFLTIVLSLNLWPLLIIVYLLFFNYLFIIICFISMLAELNSVPFDLPESESELVAGFITEYSSMYFSLMLLTEYANMMALVGFIIILFSMIYGLNMMLLLLISLISSTLNRIKFDELLSFCWTAILPLMFTFCLIMLMLYYLN